MQGSLWELICAKPRSVRKGEASAKSNGGDLITRDFSSINWCVCGIKRPDSLWRDFSIAEMKAVCEQRGIVELSNLSLWTIWRFEQRSQHEGALRFHREHSILIPQKPSIENPCGTNEKIDTCDLCLSDDSDLCGRKVYQTTHDLARLMFDLISRRWRPLDHGQTCSSLMKLSLARDSPTSKKLNSSNPLLEHLADALSLLPDLQPSLSDFVIDLTDCLILQQHLNTSKKKPSRLNC